MKEALVIPEVLTVHADPRLIAAIRRYHAAATLIESLVEKFADGPHSVGKVLSRCGGIALEANVDVQRILGGSNVSKYQEAIRDRSTSGGIDLEKTSGGASGPSGEQARDSGGS